MTTNKVSVLAFEKKLVPSDGFFYGTNWEKRAESIPLKISEKSVRGTKSHRFKKELDQDFINAEVNKPNLQKVDYCALSETQDTLKIHFTLKILSNVEHPSACSNASFNESCTKAIKHYILQENFTELAKRYAINIANARFLWRNRVGTEYIEVVVTDGEQNWVFNALNFPINNFNVNHDGINTLSKKIADALSGNRTFLLLDITAYVKIGYAQDVYPSEELVLDKNKNNNKKSKILYQIDGIAGMHSQKIGNAIRTIDTWYPAFEERNIPISIEPYGAVTNLRTAYRTSQNKADFYSLFDRFARGETLASKDEEHYVIAILVRGGVFGELKDNQS